MGHDYWLREFSPTRDSLVQLSFGSEGFESNCSSLSTRNGVIHQTLKRVFETLANQIYFSHIQAANADFARVSMVIFTHS